jgi:hypothetical protein
MHIADIEAELKEFVKQKFHPGSFIFRFLEIYDAPKATVSKLKLGSSNLAKEPGDLLWKNKLFFRVAKKGQAAAAVDLIASDPLVERHKPRLLFATDAHSGDGDRLFQPKAITHSGDRDHGRSTEQGGP